MSCLFVFVTKQPLLLTRFMASFSLVYFSHVNFLYKPKENILKKFVFLKKYAG